ncbi:bifunctional folylpolyglutamate synthase/dihydrofolate synthase [Companilactobacillus sp. DQM5]|uniref:bifunctional folylpolyglutamate synthase/dihydrofolate synthase n=1 Tax=Companilactobacillus sp. DQM5 TaxID=3463359 RepID=UPI004059B239
MNNIDEVIKYIHGLPKFHKTADFTNMNIILKRLKNPQTNYETIHITGTNGKGSVAHYINQMLINSGYKVGMFTSPYIVKFNERIQINNEFISDDELISLTNKINSVLGNVQLVEFEFVTILGFLYFSQKKVDIAVIEVGIGGTHDKTNVIDSTISIINNVGLDHQNLIGPTLKDIAIEKSGIIKKNSYVVLGDIEKKLLPIFKNKASQCDSKIIELNNDFSLIKKEDDRYAFYFQNNKLEHIFLENVVDYQVENMAVALAAFIVYQDFKKKKIDEKVINKSLNEVKILARMQKIHDNPEIILDGAHNIHAAKEITKILKNKKVKFLVAMMKDKNFNSVLDEFKTISKDITLTTFDENRSLKKEDIRKNNLNYPFTDNWQSFISNFLKTSNDETLIITGSLHFVSIVLKYFA